MNNLIELTVGPVAHGGHCVARHEGRVIFVRHTLPGEVVRARLTDDDAGAKFWRGDAVQVVEASPDRVPHPWPLADALLADAAGSQAVGGAEFGHIALPAQRRLKAAVFAEQLRRLAGVDREVTVEATPAEAPDGLAWRTRVSFDVDGAGRLGMHAHRSDRIIAVEDMPLAVAGINALRLWELDFAGMERVEVAAPANGSAPLVLLIPPEGAEPKPTAARAAAIARSVPQPASVALWRPAERTLERLRGRTWVAESALGHDYRVTGEGFWQIHREAPDVLGGAVLAGVRPERGEKVADLYAGAGLFTAPLAAAVGPAGSVLSVEGSPGTSRDARKNVHSQPQVEIIQGRVDRVLQRRAEGFDAVVLDPPRIGAGKAVVRQLTGAARRAVGYVSCDPASFARDLGYFLAEGWRLEDLRVFDLYPHTHHMESFALLVPDNV
jgi:tRNA/tmRNA/rRNA uracil-C5-methylase (TrmA/RlmC/RlmD family)